MNRAFMPNKRRASRLQASAAVAKDICRMLTVLCSGTRPRTGRGAPFPSLESMWTMWLDTVDIMSMRASSSTDMLPYCQRSSCASMLLGASPSSRLSHTGSTSQASLQKSLCEVASTFFGTGRGRSINNTKFHENRIFSNYQRSRR